MPRNTQKLKELEKVIIEKDLELAKYKQIVANIQGLININVYKVNEPIGGLTGRPVKTLDDYSRELARDGYKLLIIKDNEQEQKEAINKAVFKDKVDYDKEMPNKQEIREKAEESEARKSRQLDNIKKQQTHVDELKDELGKQAEAGEEYPKPSKIKKAKAKIPTNFNEVIEQEKEQQGENPPEEVKKSVEDLPLEAKAIIASNKARARAAEREKDHGADGDREYARLQKKEKIETGELPAGGNCPHCGEVLEAPITRGHHSECWEAKQRRETEK